MAAYKEVGAVKELPYGVKQFEWSIPDFFTIVKDKKYYRYDSPTFSVADNSWFLRLYPYWNDAMVGIIQLILGNHMKRDYLVKYSCGIKKCDGSMEQLLNGILKGDQVYNNEINFIKKAELVRRKSELVPGNVLTITCTLKLMTEMTHSSEQTVLDATKPLKLMTEMTHSSELTVLDATKPLKLMTEMTHSSEQTALDATKPLMLIRLERLSENFKDLLGDKETCDTTLKVKDREYMAHRTVLIARSSVFAATFKHDTLERQTGVITITDCDPDSFQTFLEYLYCGKLEKLSFHSAINLYYTSNKYDVEELKVFCVEYLMQCLTVENVCEIAAFANKYSETQLFKTVQDFFNKHSLKIFLTSEWSSLLNNGSELANTLLTEMAKMKLKE